MPLGSDASENISELHRGPMYRRNLRKFGKAKADRIAVAAGLSAARKNKRRFRRKEKQ